MSGTASREDENKALLRRWFKEVWNEGREEVIDELRAPDAVAEGLSEGLREHRGVDPFRAFYANMRGTFPDLRITIQEMVAEGDIVSVRLSAEGTHRGDALAPATGRQVRFSGQVMARIANGRIAEAWNSIDQLGILKQIGAIPGDAGGERFVAPRRGR